MPTVIARLDKISWWAQKAKSVLFVGRDGVGKTALIREGLEKNGFVLGKDALYYSTHDNDFVGDVQAAKVLILDNLNDPQAQKAVLELMGLKAWKGQPINAFVWAAYTRRLDKDGETPEITGPLAAPDLRAAAESFEIFVEIPYKPHRQYFLDKFGERLTNASLEWWENLPEEEQNLVNPRRLEQALQTFQQLGDMRDILPITCNVSKLTVALNTGPVTERLEKYLTEKDVEGSKLFLANENNYTISMKYITASETLMQFFLPLLPAERLARLIADNDQVFSFVVAHQNVPEFLNICKQILAAGTNVRLVKKIRRHYTMNSGSTP